MAKKEGKSAPVGGGGLMGDLASRLKVSESTGNGWKTSDTIAFMVLRPLLD